MRAGQQQRVDPPLHHRVEVRVQRRAGGGVVQPILLDQRHQQWRGHRMDDQAGAALRERMLVRMGTDSAAGGDQPHALRLRLGQHRIHPGLDHADDGQAILRPEFRQRVSRGRIAGDDDRLHPMIEQEAHILIGELPDRLRAFRAIGQAGRISEINDIFRGQKLLCRPNNRQPPYTRIEKAQRRVAHAGKGK